MNGQVFWTVEDELSVGVPHLEHREGQTYKPLSYHIMCPVCGDLWARRAVSADATPTGSFDGHYPHKWSLMQIPCRRCQAPKAIRPAGSLWLWYNKTWNQMLSPELLKREVLIAARFWADGVKHG